MAPRKKLETKQQINRSVNTAKATFVHHIAKRRWVDVVSLKNLGLDPETVDVFKILDKIPKNRALSALVQLVDVAEHKENDLRRLYKKLLDINIQKFTMAAEYVVTYKTVEPPWTAKEYMDVVISYANLKSIGLAHEMVGIALHKFGKKEVYKTGVDLTLLYLGRIVNDKAAMKHIPKGLSPEELEELIPLGVVGREYKIKLMEEPKLRFLAKYFTNVSILRGVDRVKDRFDHDFFEEFVMPSSYLSFEGLVKATATFPTNNMLNKHQFGQYMLLYGHDGHNTLNNKSWNHIIWQGESPFTYVAPITKAESPPFITYQPHTEFFMPNEMVGEIVANLSSTLKPIRTTIDGMKTLEFSHNRARMNFSRKFNHGK